MRSKRLLLLLFAEKSRNRSANGGQHGYFTISGRFLMFSGQLGPVHNRYNLQTAKFGQITTIATVSVCHATTLPATVSAASSHLHAASSKPNKPPISAEIEGLAQRICIVMFLCLQEDPSLFAVLRVFIHSDILGSLDQDQIHSPRTCHGKKPRCSPRRPASRRPSPHAERRCYYPSRLRTSSSSTL